MGTKKNIDIIDNDNLLATFSCDIAETISDKIAGLQVYSALDVSAGLLFPYEKPQDVIYHMGTVNFPIDILFIDRNESIKKIYKNIQPGSLSTFGCNDVAYVLEICGGLSDRLGVEAGYTIKISNESDRSEELNKLAKTYGIAKDIIIKYSSFQQDSISNWNGFPVVTIGNSSLVKNASSKSLNFNSLLAKFKKPKYTNINVIDLDGLIEKNSHVIIYNINKNTNDESPKLISIFGTAVSVDNICKKVDSLNISKLASDETILFSIPRSFSSFIPSSQESSKIFSEIKKCLKKTDEPTVLVSRYKNASMLKDLVINRINLEFGEQNLANKIGFINIAEDSDASNIVDIINNIYLTNSVKIISDNSLLKRAGTPVPDEVKMKARKAYKHLESSEANVKESLENLQKNVEEYDKLKENHEAIAKTKGQYNQSIKRNIRLIRSYLMDVRDSVKILNEIKDISTTVEIIDALATAAKQTSDTVQEIFDLIEKIDTKEFFQLLTIATTQYDKSCEDLISTINRAKQYINTNILGLVILSD